MKAIQFLALIIFSSVLMGCQIEVAPLDETQVSGQSSAVNSQGSTDNGNVSGAPVENTSNSAASSVTLYWSAPVERVNGDAMTFNDIGGYEIRYKKSSDDSYTNIVISDASVEQYLIEDLHNADDYVFEVAVFDNDGIYSDFVTASNS